MGTVAIVVIVSKVDAPRWRLLLPPLLVPLLVPFLVAGGVLSPELLCSLVLALALVVVVVVVVVFVVLLLLLLLLLRRRRRPFLDRLRVFRSSWWQQQQPTTSTQQRPVFVQVQSVAAVGCLPPRPLFRSCSWTGHVLHRFLLRVFRVRFLLHCFVRLRRHFQCLFVLDVFVFLCGRVAVPVRSK